jgi:inhibitor of KinA sporulation pathway (predicted exonuclease)
MNKTKLNKVIICDVESTCWETREEQGDRPNEIIEIGICTLDIKSGKIDDVSSYIVKPRFTTVSPFCTQLTGWTQAEIDTGSDIIDAIAGIEHDYELTPEHLWFSCGEYDRVKLGMHGRGSLNMYSLRDYTSIFAAMRHLNIRTLFALKHKLSKEVGMERMLQIINEPLEGRHHNGADDAANIAKIVRSVLS